ncbi:hypothetical protein GL272_14045 [Aeromonas veronii]|uniref:inverse autotransporter beta domain-containing protein n=1 Tax=Aeromonas veronii TaxID=654 RepID=UPI00130262E9|nr:inverse autotransporter beta domain-containing protein [Aeromonas veronii]MBW3778029.1 hypothetical protein [Aeromonas veronii]
MAYALIGEMLLNPVAIFANELEVFRKKKNKKLDQNQPYYVLKKGDTLSSVVKELNLDVADLFSLNPEFAELHMWKEGAVLYLPNTLQLPSLTSQGFLDIPTLAKSASVDEQITKELNTQVTRLAKSLDSDNKSSHSSEIEKSYWSSRVKTHFEQEAKAYTEKFLGQNGSARMQASLDNSFNLTGGELDVLASFYENESTLIFGQVGVRRKENRNIVNLGVGRREFNTGHMLGYNTFYDYDITNSHSRLGVGIEYWQDHLKLGSNLYFPLSGWKNDIHFDGYEARPARGIDMHAQAYLPSYPQLSGKLSIERYWGEKVDLLGTQNTIQNPYAMAASVEYQPMPFIKFTAGQTVARDGQHDLQFGIGIEWRLGASFSQMMTNSAPDRSLQGMRYDLIERNNNIVLEYQKKVELTAKIPEFSGLELQPLTLSVNVQSSDQIAEVIWFGDVLGTASGISQGSNTTLSLLSLPAAHVDRARNSYPISVLLRDIKGRETRADGVINVIKDENIVANLTLTIDGKLNSVTLNPGKRYPLDIKLVDPRQSDLHVQASIFDIQTPELQYKLRFDESLSSYVEKDGDKFYLNFPSDMQNKIVEKKVTAILPTNFEVHSNSISINIVQPDFDSNDDGVEDSDEITTGTNPNEPAPDEDSDEITNGTNPNEPAPDEDGDEISNGTNPNEPAPDEDGDEISNGTNPNDPATAPDEDKDTDEDGVSDTDEIAHGTDPNDPDTDDDGISDGDEISNGTNPNDPNDPNDPATAGDIQLEVVSMVSVRDNAVADGSATNALKVRVINAADGNGQAGVIVQWAATQGSLDASFSTTDANGWTEMTLSHIYAQDVQVTASVEGSTLSTTVTFVTGQIATDDIKVTTHDGSLFVNDISVGTTLYAYVRLVGEAFGRTGRGFEQLSDGSHLNYRWQRSNDGSTWVDLDSTTDRYTTTGADQGMMFRVHVDAH